MFFLLLLDAIGGMCLALAVMSGIRILNSYSYKYKYRAVIIDSGFSGNKFNYTVQFDIDGKPEVRDLTINLNLPKSESGQIRYAEAFSRTYEKGRFVNIVSKNKEATSGVKKEDFPIKSLIFFSIIVIAFHSSAYLTGNGFFFSI